jgi:site-specific DNA-methyltransferase (adenine-specific)
MINLIHGDCIDVMKEMSKGSVDGVITDPPYSFGAASVSGNGNTKIGKWADLLNQSYFYRELLIEFQRICVPDGCVWMFSNWRGLPVMMKAIAETGNSLASVLVWDKATIGPGMVGLRASYELVLLVPFGDFQIPNRSLPDIWKHPWSSAKPHGHPSEKPESLMSKIVMETPGKDFIDPFMGSGTTGVACVQNDKNFIGIEIDDKYFCEAKSRIENAEKQLRMNL